MTNSMNPIEPAAKALAATALSQSLSFCMERKYLEGIGVSSCENPFHLEAIDCTVKDEAYWLRIKQVGKPLHDSAEDCFTAIQKILYSCFLPNTIQLLFLLEGDGKESRMYVGLRSISETVKAKSYAKSLNEFVKGAWPGLQTELVDEQYDGLSKLKKDIADENINYVYALTGIPSMETQYKKVYPATIDNLIAGMNRSKRYAYLVVADPVETCDAESMIYQCREMNGQAESLKSINITEGFSQGTSASYTHGSCSSVSEGVSHSISESVSKKDFSSLGKAALCATGIGMAASIFPAAGAVLDSVANAAGAILPSALNMIGLSSIGNIITNIAPTKTSGVSDTTSRTYTRGTNESDTSGTSENKSQSLSRNIVNKHIEAVSEHLFYHSKRFESGKAIGLWKVGVYLMANKKTDIQGGAMQLRSILSGQESIFEPIRIHDISISVDDIRENSIARLCSPILMIDNQQNQRFEHPMGKNYKELKTVLTTKELSYLINFPLRTVPGISVVDSSPEFSLNKTESNATSIAFGKLLYGGSMTEMEYELPLKVLAKHTLLSGINGTGKTNTVQAILNGVKNRIPFLIIEPAKTEYVDWALEYNKSHKNAPIDIYIPGCKKYRGSFTPSPLRINPFEPIWLNADQDPNVLSHIDRLKSTFAAAFPMYDILPVLMEDLIYTIYQQKTTDWLGDNPKFGQTKAPTLNSMSVCVDKVIDNCHYEERIASNMKACLNTRINSLKRGWRGETLNCTKSTSCKELYERPVVINLSYVGDDTDKAFFMAVILQQLYEYRQALAEVGLVDFNNNECKHLTVIEEAHRVMMKCDNPDMPQYKSAMMFSNMLSEIRAYGEGMFLVDQVPTRLIPDAIKNTNTKITHRLVAEDDCKAVAESMGITKEQRMIIPKLLVGQCLVSTSLTTDKYWVQVNKMK